LQPALDIELQDGEDVGQTSHNESRDHPGQNPLYVPVLL
jgi:hypothetical protein